MKDEGRPAHDGRGCTQPFVAKTLKPQEFRGQRCVWGAKIAMLARTADFFRVWCIDVSIAGISSWSSSGQRISAGPGIAVCVGAIGRVYDSDGLG